MIDEIASEAVVSEVVVSEVVTEGDRVRQAIEAQGHRVAREM